MTEFEKELVRFVSGYLDAGVSAEDYVKAFSQRLLDSVGQQNKPKEEPVELEKDATQFIFDKGFNITPYQAKTIAEHFYELGQKSKGQLVKYPLDHPLGCDNSGNNIYELEKEIDDKEMFNRLMLFIDTCWGDFFRLDERDDMKEWLSNHFYGSSEKSEIPTNLDEAAEAYSALEYDCHSETDAFYAMLQREAFKAGAEWLAEQGETDSFQVLMDEVHMYGDSNMPSEKFPYCYMKLPGGIEGNYYLGEEFKEGDELIVQIRKK